MTKQKCLSSHLRQWEVLVQKLEAKLEAAQTKLKRSSLLCPTDLLPAVMIDAFPEPSPTGAPAHDEGLEPAPTSLAALMRVFSPQSTTFAQPSAQAIAPAEAKPECDGMCTHQGANSSGSTGPLKGIHEPEARARSGMQQNPDPEPTACSCTVVRSRTDPLFSGNQVRDLSTFTAHPSFTGGELAAMGQTVSHGNPLEAAKTATFALNAAACEEQQGYRGLCSMERPRGQRLPRAPHCAQFHLAVHGSALRLSPQQTSSTCAAAAVAAAWNVLCVPESLSSADRQNELCSAAACSSVKDDKTALLEVCRDRGRCEQANEDSNDSGNGCTDRSHDECAARARQSQDMTTSKGSGDTELQGDGSKLTEAWPLFEGHVLQVYADADKARVCSCLTCH